MPQTPLGKIFAVDVDGNLLPVRCDADGNLVVTNSAPESFTQLADSSGNVANAAAVSTLHPSSGKTARISGFQLTALGSTGALGVTATVEGVIGGPLSYSFAFPAGATTAANPLLIDFEQPLAATDVDVDIVVTLPAGGTGNLRAASSAQGFES